MGDLDAHSKHEWQVVETETICDDLDYKETKVRQRRSAMRIMWYPHGVIEFSESKPVPKYCPRHR